MVGFNPQTHSRTMPKAKSSDLKSHGSGLDFSNRRVNRDFSLSASNRERQRGDTEVSVSCVVPFVGAMCCSSWAGVRCRIHSSPVNNANYAWIQHFIHHLSPVGVAGFVMAKTTS